MSHPSWSLIPLGLPMDCVSVQPPLFQAFCLLSKLILFNVLSQCKWGSPCQLFDWNISITCFVSYVHFNSSGDNANVSVNSSMTVCPDHVGALRLLLTPWDRREVSMEQSSNSCCLCRFSVEFTKGKDKQRNLKKWSTMISMKYSPIDTSCEAIKHQSKIARFGDSLDKKGIGITPDPSLA